MVETCGLGIICSYHLSKTEEETDGNDDIAMDVDCKSQDMRGDKLLSEAKSVASPVPQESFTSGLLMVAATPVEAQGVPLYMKNVVEELIILHSGTVDVVSNRASTRELPECLRSHANCLLIDAGWKIDPRVRSD